MERECLPRHHFMGRKAFSIENDALRVTVLEEGGHIAEFFDKRAGVNPLWIPHWTSIEPSAYSPEKHPDFGVGGEAILLAGIMGHSLCLDLFGGPSVAEEAAGVTAHGEASVNRYKVEQTDGKGLVMSAQFPLAQLAFTRTLELHGQSMLVRETVKNLTAMDRPIGWTEHVTLAPPFLDPETTQVRASVTQSKVYDPNFGVDAYLVPGAEFAWPLAPRKDGGVADLRTMKHHAPASGYTAHLADPEHEDAFFVAFSPQHQLAFGCVWKRADFPWLGIWEENRSRLGAPWNGHGVTRGLEFGVSPFPESRIDMVERGRLFGERTVRWLPALGSLHAEYWMVNRNCDAVPEILERPEL